MTLSKIGGSSFSSCLPSFYYSLVYARDAVKKKNEAKLVVLWLQQGRRPSTLFANDGC